MSSFRLEILVVADSTRCHTENTSDAVFHREKKKTSSLNFPLSFLLSRPPRAAFPFVPLKLVHFRKEKKSLFSLSAMRTAQATKDMESFKLYNSLHSGGYISLETGPSFDHGGPP